MNPQDVDKHVTALGVKSNLLYPTRKGAIISCCALCHNMKEIYVKRYSLCSACYSWCKKWIIKQKGAFYRSLIPEAMNAYHTKVKCKYCPTMIERPKNSGRKLLMCDRCKAIYKDAQKDSMRRRNLSYRRKT